jgi:hypothetical protein
MRRLAPLLAIVLLLFILLPLLRGSKSSGLSSKERSIRTKDALALIDAAEVAYKSDHHRYTDRLADLLGSGKGLAPDLAVVSVSLDASSNGNTYVAQVASDVLSVVLVRTGTKVTGSGCLVVKRGSGVKCGPENPKPKPKP